MLPQVLAGLGSLSVLSAGCLFWLERLQPLFFTVAITLLVYQVWLIGKRPPSRRTWTIKMILAMSLALNVVVIGAWISLWLRYR